MPSVQLAVRGVRKDGDMIQVEAYCSMTEFGDERAILTTVHDISDRVKLEDQLRQAQKMEAVGRLAGGIAHDFNNLLTAIRGNAELLSHRVKKDPAMAAEVDEILQAADRAASLTRQLLAFSRKQVLQPVTLDLNEIVSGVARMARRLIGTDVQLRLDLARSVSQVLADPAQVEQVLLNLIVNARDAMPSGGRITVRTAERATRARIAGGHPGRHRARRVRDARRHGRWHRDGSGDAGAHLRTVLHDEGNRPGHGPRPVDRLRHRPADGRRHHRRE